MKILEFGNNKNKKLILIHGLESPYQIFDEYIENYKKDFHIIVPILEGHYPNNDSEFISFVETVRSIEEYYISKYGEEVYAIYGMSLGGIIATKILENQRIKINKLIIESSPLVSYGYLMKKFLKLNYLILTHKTQKRDMKTINRAIKSIISKNKLDYFLQVIDNIKDKTIINYVNEIGNYKMLKNINIKTTQIFYIYGTKLNELLAVKSAQYLKKYYPNTNFICFKGKGHCENSIMYPNIMINELNRILSEEEKKLL